MDRWMQESTHTKHSEEEEGGRRKQKQSKLSIERLAPRFSHSHSYLLDSPLVTPADGRRLLIDSSLVNFGASHRIGQRSSVGTILARMTWPNRLVCLDLS